MYYNVHRKMTTGVADCLKTMQLFRMKMYKVTDEIGAPSCWFQRTRETK